MLSPFTLPGLLSAILFAPAFAAWTGDSQCSDLICLNATLLGDKVHYQLTDLYSAEHETGWIGVGFGKHMPNSPMVVMWPTANGTQLSQRLTHSHAEPRPQDEPPSIASLTSALSSSWPENKNLTTMSFTMPTNEVLFKDSASVKMIWAYGRRRPYPEDDSTSHLWVHYRTGHFELNLTRDVNDELFDHLPSSSDSTKASNVVLLHGIFLSIGFLVLLPFGSLVGRYARSFTVQWFPVHKVTNFYIATPVIVLGWILGPIAVARQESEHFLDAHQTFGFVLLAVYFLQVWLGTYIHRRRAEGFVNAPHPPSNILHVILGLSIITLAYFQIRSGLVKLDALNGTESKWEHALLNAWSVVVPLAYFAGLAFLPRQFRQEKAGSQPTELPTHYKPLPNQDEDPLLFNAEQDEEESPTTSSLELKKP